MNCELLEKHKEKGFYSEVNHERVLREINERATSLASKEVVDIIMG